MRTSRQSERVDEREPVRPDQPAPLPHPPCDRVASVVALQQAAGNQAVGRLLRAQTGAALQAAAEGTKGAAQALPHLDRIQRSFGRHDLSAVQAFTGARAGLAARALGASAFTYGDRVAFAEPPSLRTAAHEAAHVVQQREGVQLEGGAGRRGGAYERHADRVAEAVVKGDPAERLLDEVAPGRPGRAGAAERPPSAVQGDIGIEIELPVPIADERGHNIPGEATLGRAGGVKIVTDHNDNLTGKLGGRQIACVEAVVEHVSDDRPELLKDRLDAVRILIEELNKALKAKKQTPWAEFWGGGGDYVLRSDVVDGKLFQDVGYVQFTVGVAPSVVPQFLESMEVLGAPTKGAAPPKPSAVQQEAAEYVANMMPSAAALSNKAKRDLEGYLTLCYLLVGGLYNGMRDRTLEEAEVLKATSGVMKNYARLLPRMSPGQMYETVDAGAQTFIVGQGKPLVTNLKACMLHHRKAKEKDHADAIKEKLRPRFQDPGELMTGNAKLKGLIESVGDPKIPVDISHAQLYGKMAVAQTPDPVSPNLQGVPVEVRHHAALSGDRKNQMTREEWEATALIWYRQTLRYLHHQEEARRRTGS